MCIRLDDACTVNKNFSIKVHRNQIKLNNIRIKMKINLMEKKSVGIYEEKNIKNVRISWLRD
jgi:hypothetical protein